MLATGAAMMIAGGGCGGGGSAPPPVQKVNILTGPRFWTGDPKRPWADGLVVNDGRIERVLDRAEIGPLIAAGGTVRQLPGALAVPGLVDAHGHVTSYAVWQRRAGLLGARSLDETLDRVRAFAAEHPDDAWVLGRGWDQNDWPGRAWPDAERLEQAVPGRPAAMTRVDGHALWVNRSGLAAAGITAATPDPAGGTIHRDAAGRPTGILIDRAMELVEDVIPAPSPRVVEQALADAAKQLVALGLTGVHDMDADAPGYGSGWNTMRALAKQVKFPLRINAFAALGSPLHRELLDGGPIEDGRLRAIGIKLYMDGALGSRGARLSAPYTDEPNSYGLWLTELAEVGAQARQATDAGLETAIHAIGDAGIRAALEVARLTRTTTTNRAPQRFRIEHAQIVDLSDIPRFKELGVIASMQPTHATSDMPWAEDRVGPERIKGAYAWRAFLAAGVPLAFGSDFPIESPDPRLGLYAAVTRQDRSGMPPGGWLPEQRLSLAEALAAFSAGAAYAAGQESELGMLAPGYQADLTIFEDDLFALPPEKLPAAGIAATVIAGETVYAK
jgi:hypothetical protein